MYMLEIAEEEGTGQQNWVTQHRDWKKGNMDVILGLSVRFYGSYSFALTVKQHASRKRLGSNKKDLEKKKQREKPSGTSYWRQNLIQVQPNVLCAPLDCALGKAFSELIHKLGYLSRSVKS